MRYRCIEACRGEYPVRMMARLLAVSPSGYYEWRGRPPSARAASARRLTAEMRAIHQESDGTYGSPRMRTELQARGHIVGRHRVARLMRQARMRNRTELLVNASDVHARTRAPECDRLRSCSTTLGSTATTWSIWSAVFSIPRLKRIAFCVR